MSIVLATNGIDLRNSWMKAPKLRLELGGMVRRRRRRLKIIEQWLSVTGRPQHVQTGQMILEGKDEFQNAP